MDHQFIFLGLMIITFCNGIVYAFLLHNRPWDKFRYITVGEIFWSLLLFPAYLSYAIYFGCSLQKYIAAALKRANKILSHKPFIK